MTSRKELDSVLGDAWHTKGREAQDVLQGGVTPKIEAGTSYTLTEDDAGCYIAFSNGSAVTVTVPPDGAAHMRDGTVIVLEQTGAGQVTVSAGAGVTLHAASSKVASTAQYSVMILTKRSANLWTLSGDRA